MKLIKFIAVLFAILLLNGCNGAQPTYNKDYSNEKVFARSILVQNEYQANSIINQLTNSNNKLQTFIDLKKSNSIAFQGKPTNLDNGFWYDTVSLPPYLGNTIFEMNEGSYFEKPIQSTVGWYVFYVEKKMTQQQFSQLQAEYNNKTLERIASYEPKYISEYENILKSGQKLQVSYVQPYNKKESCKIWMGSYGEDDKWFKEDSYKISWDGDCKNGFASGLGREIETADMVDRWGIAIYKQGKPTYYITNDILSNTLFEGIKSDNDEEDSYGVETIITDKANDIEVTTLAGKRNSKRGIKLLAINSPFWNGSYTYIKEYINFRYTYFNNQANDSNNQEFDFFIEDRNGKNGWAFSKYKNQPLISGEWINNKASQLDLPKIYNDKADSIIKEINIAKEEAFNAQIEAKKVKQQYLKRICKDSVKVTFMDNNEYKDICNPKKELVLMQKLNEKLNKISEAKIAKLEQEKYTAQQQKEEQHRQELVQLERNKLAEISRHNQEAESAANTANFQQSMKNLTDQINNMTPKTYNVNMFHY